MKYYEDYKRNVTDIDDVTHRDVARVFNLTHYRIAYQSAYLHYA